MKTVFNNSINQLFNQIQAIEIDKYPLLDCCMKDGVLFPDQYENSPVKIAVTLKEPYAEWDKESNTPTNCDYDFFDIIHNLKYHFDNDLNKTWLKVAAMAFAIKNKTTYSESLSYDQVVEGLSCVAWINLSKTPWKTTTRMNKAYYDRVALWEPVVKAQFLEIKPDIVFYGNTWVASNVNPIEPSIPWKNQFCTVTKRYEYESIGGKNYWIEISKYRNTNKILINGYHPGFGKSSKWQTEFIQDYLSSITI
jgi:hypothetical protein